MINKHPKIRGAFFDYKCTIFLVEEPALQHKCTSWLVFVLVQQHKCTRYPSFATRGSLF